MDIWLYYEVLHRLHTYMNPVSAAAVEEAASLLGLAPGTQVLDIASGNGELLIRLAEKYGVIGVGVDASPYTVRRAEEKRRRRVPGAGISFVHGRGEEYRPDRPFDVVSCVGASWIWGGLRGTLEALARFVPPGGLILTGEPWWRSTPPREYLEVEELREEMFFDLAGCHRVAGELGLSTIWMQAATEADWDRYEMLQLASFDDFLRECPDHPDLPEIRAKLMASKEAYLRHGRDCLGFALWIFRTPRR
ncbi:MAG: class I SAM-dependent methyltransferase [Planctomycetes bacterium]|jgi:SAM-dependent methyltransferase|nr:class I SAM-dependent methyltransferase [Planctomycetota bacterium]